MIGEFDLTCYHGLEGTKVRWEVLQMMYVPGVYLHLSVLVFPEDVLNAKQITGEKSETGP